MSNIIRFNKEDTILVVIDVQEKLMPAMADREKVERQNVKLVSGMGVLGIPKFVTTQYSKGLGPTVAPVAEALGEHQSFEKVTFSAYKTEEFKKALDESGRRTVVITGVEAHVCVEQTALDLVEAGYKVALALDCVASRTEESIRASVMTLQAAGVVITCAESVLFELTESAKAPEFKTISAIVK